MIAFASLLLLSRFRLLLPGFITLPVINSSLLILLPSIYGRSSLRLAAPLLLLLWRRGLASKMTRCVASTIIGDHVIIKVANTLVRLIGFWPVKVLRGNMLLPSHAIFECSILLLHVIKLPLVDYSLLRGVLLVPLHGWQLLFLIVKGRRSSCLRYGLIQLLQAVIDLVYYSGFSVNLVSRGFPLVADEEVTLRFHLVGITS